MLPEGFYDAADEVAEARPVQAAVSRTYDLERSGRLIDGVEAVKQAVYKILKTERFRYPVYSDDYGIECDGLLGADNEYVGVELERRITEALSVDERIDGVSAFSFGVERSAGGCVVRAAFTVNTADGAFQVDEKVLIGEA
ncbi:MAG: DUF2634 domain-containing protein [Oscillospiraceae bacterium]|nr:DUF2634 domain-containing protein [Oscillospiraceae bacterium]